MIPRFNLKETPEQNYELFTQELAQTSFSGEIRTDYGSRLVTSTDNSIYQILPQAVIFPNSNKDISCIFQLAQQKPFQLIKFSPRGGGTGTNGQSLSPGIIIDCSKYMNHILEINIKEQWARIQPGVILDELNEQLKPSGLFFAPTLSPSNRATIGGMVNTDACGKGSRIYGRTSNHVLELSYVLSDGTCWQSKETKLEELTEIKNREDIIGHIYQQVDEIATNKKDLIESQFPKMSRFLTGYNLAKVYSDKRDHFNLNYILSGSEGTLAFITEVKVRLTRLPKYKHLLVVKYRCFDDALKDAQTLLVNEPAAIETIDEKILSLAKEDNIYHDVKNFIADEEHAPTHTINLVEFTGNNAKELQQNVKKLCRTIDKNKQNHGQAIGYYHTEDPIEITHLWNLRKKGVGLLGNTKGEKKPIPFVEDTAVPPENLAAYISEFKALLEENQLEYGMFGHVDVGCLHVRPALDMKDPNDEALVRKISDGVVKLVRKYDGVMWSEHGRGFRSEYTPLFFGEELHQDLRKIKEAFDPDNKLNPGKIVTPFSMSTETVKVEASLRGHFDREILPQLRSEYESTINCNGNGACFNFDPNHVMCPSSKITQDRIHSPKGRAGMMREWLRQWSLMQQSPEEKQPDQWKTSFCPEVAQFLSNQVRKFRHHRGASDQKSSWFHIFLKIGNTYARHKGVYDFSHEVHEAMSGCLACKACASQCPIHVDVPEFRSRFFNLYYSRYLRPLRDHLVASIETITPLQARFARLYNRFLALPPTQLILNRVIGLCDSPELSLISVKSELNDRHAPHADSFQLKYLTSEEKERSVILLQDVFTTYFEAQLVLDTYDLLRTLGYVVYIAPFHPNGKPMHIKGFMHRFRSLAQKNADYLKQLNQCNIPIVGIEPSMVLTYRDEYLKSLGQKNPEFHVYLVQEWLHQQLPRFEKLFSGKTLLNFSQYKLLGHCSEKTGALESQAQWKQIFHLFGLDLEIAAVGCCGMCGTYGHEVEHYLESKGIYQMSWGKYISSHPQQEQILATGYSCRTQVKRFHGFKPRHPAQAMLKALSQQLPRN
ncbi:MAG: FAD-binding oxidoreductase [SAR324 cluster bacterium]|nr:FAD-binding oxidoreductase [SAR324 cluster bacterium]